MLRPFWLARAVFASPPPDVALFAVRPISPCPPPGLAPCDAGGSTRTEQGRFSIYRFKILNEDERQPFSAEVVPRLPGLTRPAKQSFRSTTGAHRRRPFGRTDLRRILFLG